MNEYRMSDWKRSYESIPVPAELEARVREAIRRGRRERARAAALRALRSTMGTAVAALLVIAVLANASPRIACAMERIPVLGAITRVVTFRTYEDDRGNVSARVVVPEVEGAGEINAAIEEYTDAIIAQYEADAAVQGEKGHYDLQLDYDVVTDSDTLFALRFRRTLVMASGVESVRIYNVDKATGRILSLSDLFTPDSDYLGALTQEIQRQMKEQMDADERAIYWLNGDVEGLNFTALSPDATFYVNADGQLVIVFDEGDVAPMAMGVVEFTIPAEVTDPIANPEYLK